MANQSIRVGIIGAGYIAGWHADALKMTKDAHLAAVCDVSKSAAQGLADAHGAQAFTDLDDMISANAVDAVHILTPPHLHRDLTVKCLNAGLHVLAEKPVALSGDEVADMNAAAQASGKLFAAGHNFMGIPAYRRLKALIETGGLGRINSVEANWCFPLAPLRSGPFGLWMLREPGNLLLELGPHLYAFIVDLFGTPDIQHLSLGKPIDLPGGFTRPQSWRVMARARDVDVLINLQLVETTDDRSLTVRGSSGMARLDYANDVLTISRENTADLVANPFLRQMADGWQHAREGVVNAARQVTSLNRKSPYGLSFQGVFDSFYASIANGQPVDSCFSGASAETVMRAIDETLAMIPETAMDEPVPTPNRKPTPIAMVIGGTGFIGRALTRRLVADGYDVRVLSRGSHGPFADLAEQVETVAVSLKDDAGLKSAMQGINVVFNLAKSLDKTWEDCLENDVRVTERIAQAALDAGVKRLVYTGTIASYDMSSPDGTITEDTDFGNMEDRNLYARSKAECEARLLAMHRDKGLPVVIARPGIVLGKGGPLQHWGIGRWHGAGAVRIWGKGRNILPFVLIDDVVDGLVRMIDNDAALGQSFNLVGDRMFTARDYFDAVHQRLGARIKVSPGNLHVFWMADGVKSVLKTYALRRKGVIRPSLKDWKARAHYTPFDNAKPKQLLGWNPAPDAETFWKGAIDDADLMGF